MYIDEEFRRATRSVCTFDGVQQKKPLVKDYNAQTAKANAIKGKKDEQLIPIVLRDL